MGFMYTGLNRNCCTAAQDIIPSRKRSTFGNHGPFRPDLDVGSSYKQTDLHFVFGHLLLRFVVISYLAIGYLAQF